MNKFIYFMAVGLAFTVLQVTTVEAQDTAAGLVTGGNAPADCGGVPCPTGDDAHTGGAQDCANLKNPDGTIASPDAVAICWEGQSSHADGAHAGMAPGTTAMCGDVPCPTGDDAHTGMAPGTTAMCGDVPCPTGDDAHTGMAPGTTAMCGDVPCPTGDDAHTGGAQDCANLKNPDGTIASPDAVAICWEGQSSHADSAHGGMAPGTTAMCGDVPCTSAGATSGGN
jgi:hypothetical protein